MHARKVIILALALIFALSFAGCLDNKEESGETTTSKEEEKIETTYDERGNISREDHYDSDGELIYYLTYEYDENNLLTLKTEFNENGVKHLQYAAETKHGLHAGTVRAGGMSSGGYCGGRDRGGKRCDPRRPFGIHPRSGCRNGNSVCSAIYIPGIGG